MPNRLARSTSPYLLQHQHNPVDWFPWGQEAFDEARRRNVPIFLSIGYSTCYWCHVMERESFENADIAALMNRLFVCIKVDREQRPDIDDIYMAAVQAFTQRGGWPMSVFLEPVTLKPFWAGTYFPATHKFTGIPTFPQVLQSLSHAWTTQPDDVARQATELAEAVAERVASVPPIARLGPEQVTAAASQLLKLLDRTHGGFGPAPKFPQPVFLDLLHDTRSAAADEDTKAAIDHALRLTLTRMAEGGMFDQVGGGFHRYSVDDRWLVPHFEKMLYDNALLAWTYARAFERYEDPLFARTARRICEYLIREMTSPNGAFFSAQDAEVNHREGQNYLWTKHQIIDTLGVDDGSWLSTIYGVDLGPNFQDPHHPPTPSEPASNVLFIATAFSASIWSDAPAVARLDALNAKLLEARSTRDQPSTDTKAITGWNGLAIAGLARAGRALGEPAFITAAARAADVLLARARTHDGRLFRCLSKDSAEIAGFLEDYAFLAHGLIELALAVPHRRASLLVSARQLVDTAATLFTDKHNGFFDTLADQPDLFIRARSMHDGAVPSGTSVLLNVMLDLAAFGAEPSGIADGMFARCGASLRAVSGSIAASPLSAANSTRALLRLLTIERGPVAASLAQGPAIASDDAISTDIVPVEIFADADQVTLAPGESAALTLRVRIASGYHLTAAISGDSSLEPFRVHIIGGQGLSVYADYPEGTPLANDPATRVYEGEFDLPIVLEREDEWKGTPLIALTFQACTDRACLQATTVEMDVEINRK